MIYVIINIALTADENLAFSEKTSIIMKNYFLEVLLMERLSLEELTDELKKIIRQLEEKAEATPGITIIDKRDFDGFNYAIAVRHGENIWVVYTTRHYLRISRCLRGDDSCLIAFRVTNHIPFDSVTVNEMGDYFNPYLDTVQSTKVRIEKELYGLRLIDLPFFQS